MPVPNDGWTGEVFSARMPMIGVPSIHEKIRMRFYLTSLAVAVAVIASLHALRPSAVAAQIGCGNGLGRICREQCLHECSNGSCCDKIYLYYILSPT